MNMQMWAVWPADALSFISIFQASTLPLFAVGLRLFNLNKIYSMATEKRRQSPGQRVEFLERVKRYTNERPKWTPAEGALLVNGVIPPPGCTKIPDAANQLEDPLLPATQTQLLGARRVLQDYLDHVKAGDLPASSHVLSGDFLKWCKDSDQLPVFVPKLPEFLRHLYSPGAHNPFSLSVEDELAALRMAMAAETLKVPSISHTCEGEQPVTVRRVVTKKGRENTLEPWIAKAISAAGTESTEKVWQELKQMALDEKGPFDGRPAKVKRQRGKKKVVVEALVYHTSQVQADGSMKKSLTRDALDSRLRRRHPNKK